jgi:uncharacterized membrane protein
VRALSGARRIHTRTRAAGAAREYTVAEAEACSIPGSVSSAEIERVGKERHMDKMLVVVFPTEAAAYEGSKALSALDEEGSIALYAKAVIAKDAGGRVAVMQQADEGPLGTTVGLLTGTLIGLIGGPVGAAVGAYVGTVGGGMFDLSRAGVATDFVEEVASSLRPGKVAVIAEINEEWVTPVDTRMEALGGEVLRRARTEVVDAQIASEQAAMKEEIAELEAEAAKAAGDAKSKLQKRIDAATARLQGLQSRAKAAHDADRQQLEAKLRVLQDRAARAKGEARAGFQEQTDKLRRAWERTKERWETTPAAER